MTEIWAQAALWLGLALLATLLSIRLRIATALSEIVVGTIAQLILGALLGGALLDANASWVKFLSGAGAIVLTFLAGAELDPAVFRAKWREAGAIGLVSFAAPFFGCAAVAYWGLGALAAWAESEAVLPAYMIGMVLAGTVGKDHALIRRLRTLTFGLLTPFYFIRAGSLVSVPALVAAPAAFLVLLLAKMATKIAGVYPVTRVYGSRNPEAMYTTLLMSTGLTFGTISALFGLSHQVIDQAQYSALVAAVIGSAVVPTLIANALFLPRHLLRQDTHEARDANPQPAPAAPPAVNQP